MKRSTQPTAELAITDGQRHLGRLVPHAGGYKAFTTSGEFICEAATVAEARQAIIHVDRDRQSGLQRMEDDGASAA